MNTTLSVKTCLGLLMEDWDIMRSNQSDLYFKMLRNHLVINIRGPLNSQHEKINNKIFDWLDTSATGFYITIFRNHGVIHLYFEEKNDMMRFKLSFDGVDLKSKAN